MPRRWYEWAFFCVLLLLGAILILGSKGNIGMILVGIFAPLVVTWVWLKSAARERAEQDRVKGPIYPSWWLPRSLGMRVLTLAPIVATATILVIMAFTGSAVGAVVIGAALSMLLVVNCWVGRTKNNVEIDSEHLRVSTLAGAVHALGNVGSVVPYKSIEIIRVKKNGSFEVLYLEDAKRENERILSFEILPERRQEFLDSLHSRVEAAKPKGVTIELQRKL